MGNQIEHRAFSQRQLRVGELVKQNLGELFIRNEEYPHLTQVDNCNRGENDLEI